MAEVSYQDMVQARRGFARHDSDDVVLAATGHRHSIAELREAIRSYRRKLNPASALSLLNIEIGKKQPTVPRDVLMRRDRHAHLEHASIVARLMGDPKPGEGYLARRQDHQEQKRRDPLDGLVFGRTNGIAV